MDRHAIHHRIAVRQADLDKIDTVRLAVSRERRNGAQGEVDGGVTDVEEARQGSAALRADLLESLSSVAEVDGHDDGSPPTAALADSDVVPEVFRPNQLIAVSTSLSPRPERLTKIKGRSPDSVSGS